MPSKVGELEKKIWDFIRSLEEPGTRIHVNDSPLARVKICCNGSDMVMCYYCIYTPGHEGDCYSGIKHVFFTPRDESL